MIELTTEQIDAAERTRWQGSIADLTPGELATEIDRLTQAVAVLETYPEGKIRDRGLDFTRYKLATSKRYAQRLIDARVMRHEPEKADFDAARYVDLVGLVQTVLAQPGEKRGHNWLFSCPWHGKDSEPSLTVFLPGKGWYCFGCGRGGADAASFMAEWYGCSQLEGLRWVEQMCDL